MCSRLALVLTKCSVCLHDARRHPSPTPTVFGARGFLPMRPYAFGALLVCSPIVLYVVLFLRGRADGYPAIPASVDEPAAYTKLVKYDRDEHTLVYGDETALRTGHAPLLDDGTYGKFVSSMPIVCVDVLLTRKSDGRILLVKRHSEPVVGKRIWNSPSQFRNLCKTEYQVVSPRVAAVSRRVTDRISCRMTDRSLVVSHLTARVVLVPWRPPTDAGVLFRSGEAKGPQGSGTRGHDRLQAPRDVEYVYAPTRAIKLPIMNSDLLPGWQSAAAGSRGRNYRRIQAALLPSEASDGL